MRGLAGAPSDDDLGCGPVFERRLRTDTDRPLAVAVSGGGDSLALALVAGAWARANHRRLLILTVDHGLRPQSAAWAQACADMATRLGAGFHALSWSGDKPRSGLPAAARDARHRRLATAAREAGASVLLMGHTADDVAEAQAMRDEGSTTPSPREWGPSPVWPEGRDLFILRPLLHAARAGIRSWLAARGETWIDDPSNDDLRFARARARQALSAIEPALPTAPPLQPGAAGLTALVEDLPSGFLQAPRAALRHAEISAFLGAACLCAAGTDRPPRAHRTARLARRLQTAELFRASLAGARIEAEESHVRFLREPGEMARSGLSPLIVAAGAPEVWDGRFEIRADREVTIRPLAGLASRLPRDQRRGLAELPPSVRQGLPVVVEGDGVTLASATPAVKVKPLAHVRLLAACGAILREP